MISKFIELPPLERIEGIELADLVDDNNDAHRDPEKARAFLFADTPVIGIYAPMYMSALRRIQKSVNLARKSKIGLENAVSTTKFPKQRKLILASQRTVFKKPLYPGESISFDYNLSLGEDEARVDLISYNDEEKKEQRIVIEMDFLPGLIESPNYESPPVYRENIQIDKDKSERFYKICRFPRTSRVSPVWVATAHIPSILQHFQQRLAVKTNQQAIGVNREMTIYYHGRGWLGEAEILVYPKKETAIPRIGSWKYEFSSTISQKER